MKPKKKDPWANLPSEFKTAIDNADEGQCRKVLAEVGIAQDQLMQAKKEDKDLAEKMEQAKLAGEQYREGTKATKLKTRYIVSRLEAMGKA
jgi:hypothetical protein